MPGTLKNPFNGSIIPLVKWIDVIDVWALGDLFSAIVKERPP